MFITLILAVTAFFTGFTYSEFKNENKVTSIDTDLETFIDTDLETSIDTDFIEPIKSIEIATTSVEPVIIKDTVTTFVEPTSYKPMLTYEDINYPSQPKTAEDFEKVYLYMINQEALEIEFYYSETYNEIFGDDGESKNNNYDVGFDNVIEKYPELFSSIRRYEYEMWNDGSSSTLKIKICSRRLDDVTVLTQERYFQETATQINDELHEKNVITDDMTQKEVAEELFTYVTRTLKYDTWYKSVSYTGYGAVKNQKAVCQGYTALYNYLLKLNGIECEGQRGYILDSGEGHIWTVAILDGETCYIDVTYGDPYPDEEGYSNYEYFDISKEDLSQDRTGVE